MDAIEMYARGMEVFGDLVQALGPDDWDRPTPCTAWTVRDLVNHVVYEDRWAVPLLAGKTVQEVGDAFEGDLLGDDPQTAVREAFAAARIATFADGVAGSKVSLSYGEEHASEYLAQLAADHHVHAWDLAMAAGLHDRLDASTIEVINDWFDDDHEAQFRDVGVIAAPLRADPDDAKAVFLARLGRPAGWTPEIGIAHRFLDTLAEDRLDDAMALLAEDAVFETTSPPNGDRLEGRDAIRDFFLQMFEATTEPRFDLEELFAAGENVVARSNYSWQNPDGTRGNVRGIELLRVRDGVITEMLTYVKG